MKDKNIEERLAMLEARVAYLEGRSSSQRLDGWWDKPYTPPPNPYPWPQVIA